MVMRSTLLIAWTLLMTASPSRAQGQGAPAGLEQARGTVGQAMGDMYSARGAGGWFMPKLTDRATEANRLLARAQREPWVI